MCTHTIPLFILYFLMEVVMSEIKQLLFCSVCDTGVDMDRAGFCLKTYGRTYCLDCGDKQATIDRSRWTVAQQYTKGNYQLITQDSARSVLRQTNPKNPR